jgi:hypothetical protein
MELTHPSEFSIRKEIARDGAIESLVVEFPTEVMNDIASA